MLHELFVKTVNLSDMFLSAAFFRDVKRDSRDLNQRLFRILHHTITHIESRKA